MNDKHCKCVQRCVESVPKTAPSNIIMKVYGRRASLSSYGDASKYTCKYSSALNIKSSGVVANKCRKYNLNKSFNNHISKTGDTNANGFDLKILSNHHDQSTEFEKCIRSREQNHSKHVSRDSKLQVLNDWMNEKLQTRLNDTRKSIGKKKTRENVSQVPYLGKPVNTQTLPASENIPSPTPSEEDPPSPPPRRPIRDHSRRPRSQYGNQPSSSRNYTEKIATDSHQNGSEKTITSSRSPSIRKRDIMMRRYNSTSVLPLVTPVDMNKNHLMDSRGDFSVPTNGHNDNEIKESSAVNGNQSNIHPENDQSLHPFVHMDIVGESYEARYPWQRDISTQCNLSECRHSISSGSVSSGSELSNYTAANNQNCSNYINSNCMDNRNGNPARRQSSDNIRKRHHVFKTRRPRSMTCLDSSNIYNSSSDMYRSDTNLNYRHGRTMSESFVQNSPSRKRMPLLLADDPGSVSDLESILENPYDGNPDRNYSVGGDSLSTEQLRRLEEIRGSSADLSRDNSDTASSSGGQLRNVLPSPRVSPEMWSEVPEVVVNTERDDYDPGDMLRSINWNSNYLSVPRKPQRRLSSGSLHSGSDESDNEIAPPVARRGRRAAIVDTKNFGDVSPTQLSPDVSPSNSCDEGESGSNIAERLRRRRSSHDVSMNVYPGDLLVQEHHKKLIKRNTISDFYAGRNGSTPPFGEDNKKQRQPFSLLKLMKTRSKESLHLSDVLKELKASEFKDNHLAAYKSIHWTDLIASTDKQTSITETLNISELERKRRESVWELFKSECVFLIDHLMVLKHCFLEPLKKCQVEGFLMYAEPSEIFSNLDELCYVSYTFCKDFISSLLKDMSATDFGSTAVLIKAFQRFSKHSKDGSVYHTYCLNYTNALSYLEKLRKNDEFCEFEKWCEQDQRCNRLQLADLLIGPMQHCTKLPLLLHNIQKYTEDPVEKTQIVESIEKVEMSLRQLEEKMKWLKNFERVQEIQRHLIWPSITDLDSRAFIPEYLKPKLSRQPCERLLACPSRQLLHEGAITLTESTKSFDAYMFLFDDILLITKIKKPNRKKQSSSDIHSTTGQPDNQMYTVHRQPIALDRLGVHDVMPPEATANGLKSAFVIVQISRFQQIIDVFTLQAPSDAVKASWISQILEAKGRCRALNNSKGNASKENEESSPTGCSKRGRHGKSLSIDAGFL
ncbi:uncharacterized protein LOC132758973 isoform X3 [Ruditapes philippinarum]|uniref:uncharacterized protein LOC132758973 isoform X3 n=1 Tax=Ruditapes philippinarum TaxID=129788 RepID=UPI00295BE716|nr:uncharacterized protein LOC132758973 isoform X3 [Ruditapes philippinarum]